MATAPTRTVGPGPQNLSPPPVTTSPEHWEKPFTFEEIHALAGDLGHGEIGWLELDQDGKPKGPAKREVPSPDVPHTKVMGVNPVKDEVVTPSGAPITKQMNPDPEPWDEGMLARNPRPKEKPKGPPGATVAGGNMPGDTAHPTTEKVDHAKAASEAKAQKEQMEKAQKEAREKENESLNNPTTSRK